MEKRKIDLITYAIIGILLLCFAFTTQTFQYANAISTVTLTYTAGVATHDVTYRTEGNSESIAYVLGTFGGVAFVWRVAGDIDTTPVIGANVTLTGSGSGRSIEYNPDNNAIYVATNDKFYRISENLGIVSQLASGLANNVRRLIYDDTNNLMYFCTNDVYGTINVGTLVTTTLYTDAGGNGVLDCALDNVNGFMYLTGDSIGTMGADILKVSLTTHTIVDSKTITEFYYGACYDNNDNEVWAVESSNARVSKFNSDLTSLVNVTVGTTPRFCTISTDDQARRLYVNNEGGDTTSIIDIDNDAVISTQNTCNQGVTAPKLDVRRLTNVTHVYIACPFNTNTIIIDNTVSDVAPAQEFCDIPANANILICRLGGNSTSAGVGALVGAGITDLGCNVVFVNCDDDPNPATNGLGLLIFIASIFVVVGLFYYAIGTEAFHLPLFIWIVIIIALSAFFTITGIIDPVFLILSIIAIVALASPKVISTIRGSTFGGGSTA